MPYYFTSLKNTNFSNSFSKSRILDIKPAIDVNHLVTVSNMAIDEHLTRAVGRVFQVKLIFFFRFLERNV